MFFLLEVSTTIVLLEVSTTLVVIVTLCVIGAVVLSFIFGKGVKRFIQVHQFVDIGIRKPGDKDSWLCVATMQRKRITSNAVRACYENYLSMSIDQIAFEQQYDELIYFVYGCCGKHSNKYLDITIEVSEELYERAKNKIDTAKKVDLFGVGKKTKDKKTKGVWHDKHRTEKTNYNQS